MGGRLRAAGRITAAVLLSVGVLTMVAAEDQQPADAAVVTKDVWPVTPGSALPGGVGAAEIGICIVPGSSTFKSRTELPPEVPDGLFRFLEGSTGIVSDPQPTLTQWIAAARGAVESTWERFAGIRFTGWGLCPAPDVALPEGTLSLYIGEPPEGYVGCSNCSHGVGKHASIGHTTMSSDIRIRPWGLGQCLVFKATDTLSWDHYVNPIEIVQLDKENIDFKWRYDLSCAKEYTIHELGHVLGLKHEFNHPNTPENCRNDETPVAANDYSTSWPVTGSASWWVPNPNGLDGSSIMMYDSNPCTNQSTIGTRFGGREPSAADYAAVSTVYPPVVDVGVLAPSSGCGTREEVTLDFVTLAAESGWTGGSGVGIRTIGQPLAQFRFCRVDGNFFKPLLRTGGTGSLQYSVLRLQDICPPGAVATSVQIDLANDFQRDWVDTGGHLGPSGAIATTGLTGTFDDVHLELCTFLPVSTSSSSTYLFTPPLEFPYGVFAASNFRGGNASGFIGASRWPNQISPSTNKVQCFFCDAAQGAELAQYVVAGSTDVTLHISRVGKATPVVVPQVTGDRGVEDWYRSDVHVHFEVTNADTTEGCEDQAITVDTDADGLTFTCVARNEDGPTTRSVTVKRDTINPPVPIITAGPSGTVDVDTATFRFFADEVSPRFECRVDGSDPFPCGSPHDLQDLLDGQHGFDVRLVDRAGNVSNYSSRVWTVDTTDPATILDEVPSDPVNSSQPRYRFHSDESGTFECSIDSGSWFGCASPYVLPPQADGLHTFAVRAVDVGGNVDPTPATHSVTIDVTPPGTGFTQVPPAFTNLNRPTFRFAATEPATWECRTGSAAFVPCPDPFVMPALADGAYRFEARAVDLAGNVDPTPVVHLFTVDTVAPSTTVLSGPADVTNDSTPTFAFGSDELGSFECLLDGAAGWSPCASPFQVAELADGAHVLRVRAVDYARNIDASPAEVRFTVDTVAPVLTITASPPALGNDASPSVAFEVDEAATVECAVDGGDWAACVSPATLGPLPDGDHTVDVRATDTAGNVSSTASADFATDTVAPTATITDAPAPFTNDPTPTIGFEADEPATFECAVDGAPWTACESPSTVAALPDGLHTVAVRAADPAGNVQAAPATATFTVDTAAPSVSITSGPDGPTVDDAPAFGFGADEPSTFRCRLDDGAPTDCTSPFESPSLSDGDQGRHTFSVTAVDRAGNVSGAATRSFIVTAPTRLVAEPASARVAGLLQLRLQPSAVLRHATTGAGVAGRTVVFSTRGREICRATTDVHGQARCTSLRNLLEVVLGLGYDAAFAGDGGFHAPANAHGSLVSLG